LIQDPILENADEILYFEVDFFVDSKAINRTPLKTILNKAKNLS
jgi:hypothetical protein